VLGAYGGKCCVTECTVQECLETAHIDRYAETTNNMVTNGLALRADLHRLFDANLLSFRRSGNDLLAKVDKAIQEKSYRDLNDKAVRLPANRACWPDKWFFKVGEKRGNT
jgi:putative restriction endonuclease